MRFSNLKSKSCPKCGCDSVIREELEVEILYGKSRKIRQHCNGQQWESRTFLCGAKVDWIPNFEQDVWHTSQVCTNSPEYQAYLKEKGDLQRQIDALEKQKRDLFNERFKTISDT